MGAFAGRLDAWIVAEGIETMPELKALSSLRVPLAQGYLLGRPETSFRGIDPQAAAQLMTWRDERLHGKTVRIIMESPHVVTSPVGLATTNGMITVLVDEWQRPTAVVSGDGRRHDAVMRVKATSPADDVLRRALARDEASRFAPVAVIDEIGQLEGVVRVERLMELVAFGAGQAGMAGGQ